MKKSRVDFLGCGFQAVVLFIILPLLLWMVA